MLSLCFAPRLFIRFLLPSELALNPALKPTRILRVAYLVR